ncbi:AMP-binding protein [Microbacterium sp.]|uniref:AMP-binding protein n=1 Tax=Microbacterium sp. TaxID=51671 RepID=UPI0037CC3F75
MTSDDTTVLGAFRRRLAAEPDADFVRCGGDWLTFADLDERTDRLATGLAALGAGEGTRIATILPNRIEAVEILLASAKLGAIQVPLNYHLKGDFLGYQLDDCGAEILIADTAGADAAAPLLTDAPVRHFVHVDEPQGAQISYRDLFRDGEPPRREQAPDDIQAIMYTSGTTAAAKGCILSAGYYVAVGRAYGIRQWVIPGDRVFTGFPMFHTSGQMVAFMSALVNDASISIMPEFHASTFMADAAADGATMVVGVGPMAHMLLAQPERPEDRDCAFRLAVWVPLGEAEQLEFERRFSTPVISEGYGQTECVPITNTDPTGPRNRASSGRISPLLDVRIVDDHDNEVPQGEAGEIVVRPLMPNVMYSGYWNKADATVETWRNLWHHTGDFGRIADDGCLVFVDRKKDILRRRGENVSALALENVFRTHEAIADVAVSAVPADVGDDEIKASVVLTEGAVITPQEFFEFAEQRLPYFAVPRYVDIRDQLPVNALSRVMKHVLRDEGVTGRMWDLHAQGLIATRQGASAKGSSR